MFGKLISIRDNKVIEHFNSTFRDIENFSPYSAMYKSYISLIMKDSLYLSLYRRLAKEGPPSNVGPPPNFGSISC